MRKHRSKVTEEGHSGLVPTGEPPLMDEADGVRVGEEPVPGMRLRCICRGHQGYIGRIAWSPCGRFIASPSEDKTIRIWDTETGVSLSILNGWASDVAWSPTSKRLAIASQYGPSRIWSIESKKDKSVALGPSRCSSVVWRPKSQCIVSGRLEGGLNITDTSSRSKGY